MRVTDLGIITLSRALQPRNAAGSMLVVSGGIRTHKSFPMALPCQLAISTNGSDQTSEISSPSSNPALLTVISGSSNVNSRIKNPSRSWILPSSHFSKISLIVVVSTTVTVLWSPSGLAIRSVFCSMAANWCLESNNLHQAPEKQHHITTA